MQNLRQLENSDELENLFKCLCEALISETKGFSAAFENSGLQMVDGVSFQTSRIISKATLDMAMAIVSALKKDHTKISIPEVRELGFKVFAALVSERNSEKPTSKDFCEAFVRELNSTLLNRFSYLARCHLFRFEDGVTELVSDFVSVKQGHLLLEELREKRNSKHFRYDMGQNFEIISSENGTINFHIPKIYWEVNCDAPKDTARREAEWMTNVFVSLLRLGITRPDYCHRPTLGKVEAKMGEGCEKNEHGLTQNDKGWSGYGFAVHSQYKVDAKFSDDFHSKEFQSSLSEIFTGTRKTLGFRLANCLGWLTRARQTADYSERLLFNFTAIEALLSEQGSFAPVAETIARFASVILAKDSENRFCIYSDMKKHYSKRSDLVHRGQRDAHLIDSNNVQYLAEACAWVVLDSCNLKKPHADLLKELKKASHGLPWP